MEKRDWPFTETRLRWGRQGWGTFEGREEVSLARTVKVRGRQEWVRGLQELGSHCSVLGHFKIGGSKPLWRVLRDWLRCERNG